MPPANLFIVLFYFKFFVVVVAVVVLFVLFQFFISFIFYKVHKAVSTFYTDNNVIKTKQSIRKQH